MNSINSVSNNIPAQLLTLILDLSKQVTGDSLTLENYKQIIDLLHSQGKLNGDISFDDIALICQTLNLQPACTNFKTRNKRISCYLAQSSGISTTIFNVFPFEFLKSKGHKHFWSGNVLKEGELISDERILIKKSYLSSAVLDSLLKIQPTTYKRFAQDRAYSFLSITNLIDVEIIGFFHDTHTEIAILADPHSKYLFTVNAQILNFALKKTKAIILKADPKSKMGEVKLFCNDTLVAVIAHFYPKTITVNSINISQIKEVIKFLRSQPQII